MRASLVAIVAVSVTVNALEPDDVKGIIADTVVSGIDQCWALCNNNAECRHAIYNPPCHECWQLDCIDETVQAYDYEKPGVPDTYSCKMDLSLHVTNNCSNLTATATVTGTVLPSQTAAQAAASTTSAAAKAFADWPLPLVAVMGAMMLFAWL